MNRKFIIGIIIAVGIGIISTILYENSQISSKNTASDLSSLISKVIRIVNSTGPRHLSINPSESIHVNENP